MLAILGRAGDFVLGPGGSRCGFDSSRVAGVLECRRGSIIRAYGELVRGLLEECSKPYLKRG